MSTRKSNSSGEGLPSNRDRTPLRSLGNEMLHLSTASRFKSKSLLNADVKPTKGDAPQEQSPPSTKVTQINLSNIDIDETACGLNDVTFKSFICSGGEVEITDSFLSTEKSIILPKEQAMKNTCETEDTVISDSMMVQSFSDHIEHPYHNPEMKDASLVGNDEADLCEIVNPTLVSEDLDSESGTQYFNKSGNTDVTWKSFACDGGEVEVCDITKLQDETIPLPQAHLTEPLQDDGVNSTILTDCGQLCEVEHADHPYSSSDKGLYVATTENRNGAEEPAIGLSDVTFKSFNCTGGEIQISDQTELADETVPLLTNQTAACSESNNYGMDPSILTTDQDLQNGDGHLDHPYCNVETTPSTPSGNGAIAEEAGASNLDAEEEVKHISLVVPDLHTDTQQGVPFRSFISSNCEVEDLDSTGFPQQTSPLPDDQAVICQTLNDNSVPSSVAQEHVQDEQPNSHVENVVETETPAIGTSSLTDVSLKALDDKSVISERQEMSKKHSIHSEDSALPSALQRNESSHGSPLTPSAGTQTPGEEHLKQISQVHLSRRAHEDSEAKDSALGSSGNGPALGNSAEKPCTEHLPNVLKVLSQYPSVVSALQSGVLSPAVRRASLFVLEAKKDPAVDLFLADDSALDGEKSLLAPFDLNPTGLWAEQLESPMPRPLFNSTVLSLKAGPGPVVEPAEDVHVKPCAVPQHDVEKPAMDIPLIPDGPLQQQLWQMAQFLFLASGKMDPTAVPAPVPPPPAVVTAPSARASPVESHSICVGTTPMKCVDHSVNTSGQFERKREFSVVDSCTLTDPLLWNVPPGSLECLPRPELEQRLRSSMIMVEALVQQLTTARTQGCSAGPAGPAPSDLREKMVQTDHTELSQTTMHRDLYLEALNRIGELELDGSSLLNLIQCMQDTRATMTSLSCDTDAALSNMKQIGDVVRDDHQSLVSHYGRMTSLFEKTKKTHTAMMQKVKDALHQRDDMRTQMEEAFTAKEAAFSAMDQLRTHCATEISELERLVGVKQELSAALEVTHPELVALNQAYTETLTSASDVLSTTLEEQSSLMKELCTVRGLLQKTAPVLLRLNETAAAALRERDEHISARDEAVEEREQMREEWNQTHLSLQTAREQIGDLNLQVTILTSEMGVLRQKLTEREDERGQLERKATELSATVSSTLASYTFLEQALAAETAKLQQSWKDIQESNDRANLLESSLGQSEQRVSELTEALAHSDEQLAQLQTRSQSQSMEIQQLQDLCTQLSGVRDMNEFLQMENELAREQMAESERMLRANLQGLRERNIQCEDLKAELGQLRLENKSLQEELETTRSSASATELELREKLAQTGTEIALLHHTLRGATNELHAALNDLKPELPKAEESQALQSAERRNPSSSFVDSIMVALTAEKEEDAKAETSLGHDEPECGALFTGTGAFTRVAAVTPKKGSSSAELESEEEDQSCVSKLFAGLDSTVSELVSTLELVRQRKDAQLGELHNTICGLQVEQEAAHNRHQAEVFELQHQLKSLNSLVEKGSQVLQQKSQDEKTVTKLMSEIQETQEFLTRHKAETNELRKEVVELRRSLQQSNVECQFLRGELRKAGGQSAPPAHFMEEKIHLLKEVERLKASLQEVEQARVKLLDRAKRHQIIHQTNQQKSENELQLLNNMINKVREMLLCLPDAVKRSEQIQQLVEYIG